MRRSRHARWILLLLLVCLGRTAGAAPLEYRYHFILGNTPFRSFGGLLGNSGAYDLVGGFSVTLDQEQGTALLHDVEATLQGVPDDFDLNGVDLRSALGLYDDPVVGTIEADGSVVFEQCHSGSSVGPLACSAAEEVIDVSGSVNSLDLESVLGKPTYPFARRTRLSLVFEDGLNEVSLTGGNDNIHFVLDAGRSQLTLARATLVPEPAAFVLGVLAATCLLSARRQRP